MMFTYNNDDITLTAAKGGQIVICQRHVPVGHGHAGFLMLT